jgi:diacylglycerol kinase
MSLRLKAAIVRQLRSFQHAFSGWVFVLRTQPNARIHAVISIGVVILAYWLNVARLEWVALILTLMVVWMAEFTNTAVEALVDLVAPEPHPLAKVTKDVAAATVLIGALGAILVGLLILGPPLCRRLLG